jgi:hypothetical protein
MRLATPVALVSGALIAAGCVLGDSGVHFYAINNSSQPVIVQFSLSAGSTPEAHEVPAIAFGYVMDSLGPTRWAGTVRVVDMRCRLLFEKQIDAGSGGIVIGPDGDIAWSSDPPTVAKPDFDAPPALRQTTQCDGPKA